MNGVFSPESVGLPLKLVPSDGCTSSKAYSVVYWWLVIVIRTRVSWPSDQLLTSSVPSDSCTHSPLCYCSMGLGSRIHLIALAS